MNPKPNNHQPLIDRVEIQGEEGIENNAFDLWFHMSSTLFDSYPSGNTKKYRFNSRCYQVEDLIFTNVYFNNLIFKRSKRHLQSIQSDFIMVQLYRKGCQKGLMDGGQSLLNDATVVSIQDLAHCYTGIGYSPDNYAVLIPRHYIDVEDYIYRDRPFFSYQLNSLMGKIIVDYLDSIWQTLPTMTLQEAPVVKHSFIGMLNGIFRAEQQNDLELIPDNAKFLTIRDYILAHLDRRDITIEHLCSKFATSRSSIYRMFKDYGGVKKFVTKERLRKCYQILSTLHHDDAPEVQTIARSYGFDDISYFSRLFKNEYLAAPSNFIDSSLTINTLSPKKLSPMAQYSPSLHEQIKTIQTWLKGW